MSDLFGNHIVGFPTRRLICNICLCIFSLNEDDDTLNETNQQVHESHSSHWSEGMLQYIKQTVRLAGSSGNDYPQVDSEGEGSPKRAIECT